MKRCRKCGYEGQDKEFQTHWRVCHDCYVKYKASQRLKHRNKCLEYSAKYHSQNKIKEKEYYAKYYKKNKKRLAEQKAEYYAKNKKKVEAMRVKYNRNRDRSRVKTLSGFYLKRLIHAQTGLCFAEITPELVELKREQLLLFREMKKLKGAISGATTN